MNFAKQTTAAGLIASALISGCAPNNAPATTSENPYYDSERTPLNNLKTDCTIITRETGTVFGGRSVYEPGTASRVCVANNNADIRNEGAYAAIRDFNRTVYQVEQTARTIDRIANMFNFAEQQNSNPIAYMNEDLELIKSNLETVTPEHKRQISEIMKDSGYEISAEELESKIADLHEYVSLILEKSKEPEANM